MEWDRLAWPATFYLSHDWVRTIEPVVGMAPSYLVAEGEGRTVGLLPLYVGDAPLNGRYRPALLLEGLSGRWEGRFLLAGSAAGYHTDLLIDAGLERAHRRAVVGGLVEELRAAVEREAAIGAFVLYAGDEAADELATAAPDLVRLRLQPEAEIVLPGSDVGDYLAGLPGHRRRRVRHEMRAFAACGYECATEPFEDVWREAAPLAVGVERRHGGRLTVEQMGRVLRAQADALGRRGIAFTARRRGRLVGLCLAYEWGDALYARLVGFEYAELEGAFEYFNLTYYRPIEHCYRRALRRLHLGLGAYEAKVLRGAVLRPLWALVLAAAVRPAKEAVHRWNREQARLWEISTRCGGATTP